MHILAKTNYFEHILQSLYRLKHTTLAKELIEHFEFQGLFHWQAKAESGELFHFPIFAGYH